jgi:hypothetical protein
VNIRQENKDLKLVFPMEAYCVLCEAQTGFYVPIVLNAVLNKVNI